MKTITIENYEKLKGMSEEQLKENCIFSEDFKGYNIYLIKSEPYYGLITYVIKNGNFIYSSQTYKREISDYLSHFEQEMKYLNNLLFTDEELQKIGNYRDYRNKVDFINNRLQREYKFVSIWGEKTPENEEFIKKGYYLNKICFGYVDTKEAQERILSLYENLEKQHWEKIEKRLDYFRSAVAFELSNHEAGYTGEYEEGLRAVGYRFENLTAERQNIVIQELRKQMKNCY